VRCSDSPECASELALDDVEGFAQNRLFFGGADFFSVHSVLLNELRNSWFLMLFSEIFLITTVPSRVISRSNRN
jgi:hypothetical protein